MTAETKCSKPTKFSRPLRTAGLKAEDVRQFSKVFSLKDSEAAKAILSTGITGRDVRSIQHDERIGRREAVRVSREFFTAEENAIIQGFKNTPGRE